MSLDDLTKEFEAWLDKPEQSNVADIAGCAFDMSRMPECTNTQRAWLVDFCERWWKAEDAWCEGRAA